jgi:hypothetical protein
MKPQDDGVWRKTRRKVLRGVSTGRRATHEVRATYGCRQRERDRRLAWQTATAQAEMAADMAAREDLNR